MKTIKSRDNSIYKSALKLLKKKHRSEAGLYLLEGIKPLEDAIATGINIKTVFLCEGLNTPERFPQDVCIMLDEKLFGALSDTKTSQGVIAVVEQHELSFDEFASEISAENGNIVVLDRLQDPGNIGTIIRTAEAAGYKGIIVLPGTGDVYSPKVVRAAAGSLFRIPVLHAGDVEKMVLMLRRAGKRLTVSCLDEAENCFEADLTENIALVIGNEGRGVSEELKRFSDIRVKIPMKGSIESLNAAVAAGILMYQSQKKNNER